MNNDNKKENLTIIFDGDVCGIGEECPGYEYTDAFSPITDEGILLPDASDVSESATGVSLDCDSHVVDWSNLNLFPSDLECTECADACVDKLEYNLIEGTENNVNQTQMVKVGGILKEALNESDCYVAIKVESESDEGVLYLKATNGSDYLEEKQIELENGSYKIRANVKEEDSEE